MNDGIKTSHISAPDKEILLIEVGHVSAKSTARLEELIGEHAPDTVCVAIDAQRLNWLEDRESWESLDLMDVIRRKEMALLSSHLALRVFQKRVSVYDDQEPGDEMWAAVQAARRCGAQVELIDRDVRTTGIRAWRLTPYLRRAQLAVMLTVGTFRRSKPDEEARITTARYLKRMHSALPAARAALLEERDAVMSRRVLDVPGARVVAVVNAVNGPGLTAGLAKPPAPSDVEALSLVPPKTLLSRVLPWAISAAIVLTFVLGFAFGDTEKIQAALMAWLIINAIAGASFTAIAFGHPATVIAVALAAPFVSLNPAIGAGMVGGFVQTLVAPPSVRDMERVGDDVRRWQGWWRNRLARIFLILVLANVGSSIGSVVALAWFPDIF